jgi:hypothetical protein
VKVLVQARRLVDGKKLQWAAMGNLVSAKLQSSVPQKPPGNI